MAHIIENEIVKWKEGTNKKTEKTRRAHKESL